MTNTLKTLNAYMVNNIIKNTSDINEEIRNNILTEIDKYSPNKPDFKPNVGSNAEVLYTPT
jgi:hypothetical protein